jgi:hypothetical protein
MRECWHVVEVYFCVAILRMLGSSLQYLNEPWFLAFSIADFLLIVALTVFVYRGNRLASRLLAVHIVLSSASTVAMFISLHTQVDVYLIYRLLVEVYFVLSAIKLWRIKELPTRFIDPPAGESVHR